MVITGWRLWLFRVSTMVCFSLFFLFVFLPLEPKFSGFFPGFVVARSRGGRTFPANGSQLSLGLRYSALPVANSAAFHCAGTGRKAVLFWHEFIWLGTTKPEASRSWKRCPIPNPGTTAIFSPQLLHLFLPQNHLSRPFPTSQTRPLFPSQLDPINQPRGF